MVELLATIVILGLLVGVAIVAVSWILDSSEKNFYESLEKNLLLAAENYYADHRGALPKAIGQSRKLSLNTLVKTNYMKKDSIVDYGKSPCNLDSSYVQVIKYSKKDYIYTLHLECPAKKIDHEKEALNSLKVSVTLDWQPKAIESSKANIKITVDGAVSKIASYQYTIYKNGQVAYNSSSISAGSVDSVNKSIALKNYVPGAIRFVVTAYDIHGNSKTAMVSDSIYNNDVPDCGNVTPVFDIKNDKDWENDKNASRKLSIRCIDTDTRCVRSKFSKTFKDDMVEGYITIEGTNGKTRVCPATVMIDKTAPVCGSNTGVKTWTASDRVVRVNCSDATSGCTNNSFSKTYNTANKVVITDNITIKDKASNTKSCPVDVYVDKEKPKCGAITGASTSWTAGNRTITVACSDGNGSGCKKSSYTQTFSSTTKTANITIEDNVGNKTNCPVNVYVDKTAPTTPTGGNIGGVSGSNPSASIVTPASGSSDSHSGFSHYLYLITNNSSTPANSDSRFSTSRAYTRSCGTSYYAWAIAVDKVGNRSTVKSLGNTKDGANVYGAWSSCSAKCGGGTQSRTNSCALVTSGKTQNCNTQSCCSSTYAGSWSGWSGCSASCGGGTQSRTRPLYSNYNGQYCSTETGYQSCNTQSCCSSTWTSWGNWGGCSASCGGGTQTRYGTKYSNYTGQNCGSTSESRKCNTQSCCRVEHYGGRFCYNYFGASCYSGRDGCSNTYVCKGNNTGCVHASSSACGKMGGTYFYFKRC